MNEPIMGFFAEYRWLSNFWPAKVIFEGEEYASVEHAYQAAKSPPMERGQFRVPGLSAAQAKKLGRRATLPEHWEGNKVPIMLYLLYEKFCENPDLKQKLLATGDRKLVEENFWNDTFWGLYNGVGKNTLGKLIMNVRETIRVTENW